MGFVSEYHNKYQTGGMQHLLARHIRTEVGEAVFDAYFKFAFVRNPWDKAVSQYAYMKKRPDLRTFLGMEEDDSFKRYLELTKLRKHVQWEAQWMFLFDDDGKQLVDYIGRFEHLAEDAAKVFDILGIQAEVPHLNVSGRSAMETYYDSESAAMVAEMYRADIDLFGYGRYAPKLSSST